MSDNISADTIKATLDDCREKLVFAILAPVIVLAIIVGNVMASAIHTDRLWTNGVTVSAKLVSSYTTDRKSGTVAETFSYDYQGKEYTTQQKRSLHDDLATTETGIQLKIDPQNPTDAMAVLAVPVYFIPLGPWINASPLFAFFLGFVIALLMRIKAIRISKTMPDEEALEYLRKKYSRSGPRSLHF